METLDLDIMIGYPVAFFHLLLYYINHILKVERGVAILHYTAREKLRRHGCGGAGAVLKRPLDSKNGHKT